MKQIDVREKKYILRFDRMKAERENMLPIWRDISDYIAPHRGLFDDTQPNQGKRENDYMIDPTPLRALGTLQAGMQGGLTSPSRAWFQLTLSDPELASVPSVMMWLDDVQEVISNVLSQSNIYNCLHGLYGEIGAFGIGAMFVDEDDKEVVNGKLLTAGEYFVSFDAKGIPDGFGRYLWMTVEQMAGEFGKENLSERVRGMVNAKRGQEWVKVCHLICPDKEKETRFPYVSLYWEDGQRHSLSMRGYEEFPVMIPRWEPIGSDFYGYGPGWLALGESKTLQAMREDYMVAQKMNIQPPVVLPMSAAGDRMQLYPGAVNYASDPANIARPVYQIQPDIPGQMQAIADSRQLINQIFYTDLFLMIAATEDGRQWTATEANIRQQEKLQMMGPVTERLEHELLNPLIGRSYMICQRRGMIPAPPEELQGKAVKIEYVSMLALAQKASAMGSIDRMMALIAGLAGMNPEVIDKLDADEVLDQFVKLSAIPAVLIRQDEQVAAIREQRQAQQEQAQAMMQAQALAQAAESGAGAVKDLSTSPIQGGSVMDAMFNQQGGGSSM
ncbi:MAG: head-tail connector protein [Synergistaceae bacterium]|jgi:hypothetical protein|nr:head-tail connector protein [Synergistaceae bacterium]